MATDQGKLSNINGISLLAKKIGKSIPDIGTTTFRPPYVPISLGSITGAEKKALFKPTRKTVIDQWHDRNQAFWEPVGDWRRPFSYIKESETVEKSVEREVRNTRMNVGILDASTLGKILVSGPDSGKFLDLIYTNMMSTLPIGKCKYGLMCNENGFLFDDGVVVRLNKDFLPLPYYFWRSFSSSFLDGRMASDRVVDNEGFHYRFNGAILSDICSWAQVQGTIKHYYKYKIIRQISSIYVL